jgi:pyruvate dehydrogenase E1 component
MIRAWVPRRYTVLGTDGFGRSDSRAALRDFFEVDRNHIVVAALKSLADEGTIDRKMVGRAIEKYGIATERANPWDV